LSEIIKVRVQSRAEMDIVKTTLLKRTFKDIVAVDNLSLHVKQGEVYGFLGLNGAGKTTTIRMLLGMIKPTSGEFQLFGSSIKSGQMNWNDVGYMVEKANAYPNLTVTENLQIYAKLRHLDGSAVAEIIDRLQLTTYRNKSAGHLSQGNQQRLGIAKALMHKPRLLILDEPINGLDPQGIVQVRELLEELTQQGMTVFLSSHILSEISKLATRIGIIHKGKLKQELDAGELEKQLIKKLVLDSTDNAQAATVLHQAGHTVETNDDGLIELTDHNALASPENVATLLVQKKCPPTQLFTYVEDLEHYFLRIIEEDQV